MKNFICTSEGFVKSGEHRYDKVLCQHVFEILYTDKVREAKQFKTSGAKLFMEKYNIKGFVWKPYEQEPVRDMYVVTRNKSYLGMHRDDNDESIWVVERVTMENKSDVKFLFSEGESNKNHMDLETANAKALELNTELMNKLSDKVKEISKLKL